MSAAEHLREAIDVGCTRDDHDHVADHRAEVLAEAEAKAREVVARLWGDGTKQSQLDRADGARVVEWEIGLLAAGKDTGGAVQAPAGESTQPSPAELLALATALEIPRPGNALPLRLRRSYGHVDRWAILDREGRCWDRDRGWIVDHGGIAEDKRQDNARFTLVEAVPLARQLAEAPACGRCHHVFDPTNPRFDGRAQHSATPFCRRCVDRCHEATDAFHRCAVCISPTEAGEAR